MTTEGFLKHLKANLAVDVDLDSWVYSPGLPTSLPVVQTEELEKVAAAVKAFTDGTEPAKIANEFNTCLLYTSPSPRDGLLSRMPSSA